MGRGVGGRIEWVSRGQSGLARQKTQRLATWWGTEREDAWMSGYMDGIGG